MRATTDTPAFARDRCRPAKGLGLATVASLARLFTRRDLTSSQRGPDILSISSFAVCATFLLSVAGGTWAFYARSLRPPVPQLEATALAYVMYAGIACALLIVPILSVGAAAAKLDASRREQRLANLRLIGATSGDVVALTVLQAGLRAAIGTVIGVVAYLASLPLWAMIPFQGGHLAASEMLLPWYVLAGLAFAVVALGVVSSAFGLAKVAVSPLGVARRSSAAKVSILRLVLVAVVIVGWLVVSALARQWDASVAVMVVLAFLAGLGFVVDLVGPWIVRLFAHFMAKSSRPTTLVAARRMGDTAKTAWRQASGLAFVTFIAGVTSAIPDHAVAPNDAQRWLVADTATGVVLTVAIAFTIAAFATGINQAALVYERAAQTQAMAQIGWDAAPRCRARRVEVLSPIIGSLAVAVGLSVLFVAPIGLHMGANTAGLVRFGVVVVGGLALVYLGTTLAGRLEARLLAAQ